MSSSVSMLSHLHVVHLVRDSVKQHHQLVSHLGRLPALEEPPDCVNNRRNTLLHLVHDVLGPGVVEGPEGVVQKEVRFIQSQIRVQDNRVLELNLCKMGVIR